jgi:hypothetical protein
VGYPEEGGETVIGTALNATETPSGETWITGPTVTNIRKGKELMKSLKPHTERGNEF